ncbi:hypothetical protein D3C87_717530 [compost metagenome]
MDTIQKINFFKKNKEVAFWTYGSINRFLIMEKIFQLTKRHFPSICPNNSGVDIVTNYWQTLNLLKYNTYIMTLATLYQEQQR